MHKKNTKFDSDEKPFITSVTLGGFQVFEEPTTIPLGKLTFLFGPNSAGKSAVEDGLAFLLHLVNDGELSVGDTDNLEQHWRRDEQGYSPYLTMGLTASIPTDLRACLDVPNLDEGSSYPSIGHEIGVLLRYQLNEDWDGVCTTGSFELAVDGIPILELDEGSYIGLNFGHPMLAGFILSCDYNLLSRSMPDFVSISAGWVKLHSNHVFLHKQGLNRESVLFGVMYSDQNFSTPSIEFLKFEGKLRAAVDEVSNFFDRIKYLALGNMTVAPDIVPASRTIPSRKDLIFLFPGFDTLLVDCGFSQGDSRYEELAIACLYDRLGVSDRHNSDLLKSVNRALSDHLFLERGYQISANFRSIRELSDVDTLAVPEANRPTLVQVFLKDSHGRNQAFDQVGSGLGYVLPVLCSIASRSVSISLIQQPELHLHPALQAALGDVLIECADDQHQIIVETHSEHLLLRVLKRIRQTSQGKTQAPELLLAPDDVVVAYFDPQPDGTTTVRRLRISEDGDFLDRWPRGFFTERDEELFDE